MFAYRHPQYGFSQCFILYSNYLYLPELRDYSKGSHGKVLKSVYLRLCRNNTQARTEVPSTLSKS